MPPIGLLRSSLMQNDPGSFDFVLATPSKPSTSLLTQL
mgnify:CR=1 FL=1